MATVCSTVIGLRLSTETIEFIGWAVAASIIMAVVGSLCAVGLFAKQRYRFIRARADKAVLESSLIQSGGETWVKEHIAHQDGSITVEYARLGGIRLRINSHDHNPTESERLYATTQITTGQTKMLAAGQIIPQLPAQVDLLPLLDRAERVLIKGASDAGKTTLLQHIANRSNGVFIIDPHYAPGIWPISEKRIVGAARNYPAIDRFLAQLIDQLNSRYERRAKGELNFEPITLIIDEFSSIRIECNEAGKILSTLVRESRKVGFRLFIGSHSELVKPLGLEGQGDVREGLLIVRLSIDQITRQRVCKVDAGSGETDCYFPPFGQQQLAIPDLVIQPNDIKNQIKQMMDDNQPYHVISQAIWGDGKIGSYYNRKIDQIMGK